MMRFSGENFGASLVGKEKSARFLHQFEKSRSWDWDLWGKLFTVIGRGIAGIFIENEVQTPPLLLKVAKTKRVGNVLKSVII